MKTGVFFCLWLLLGREAVHAQTSIFTYGTSWKYLDNGTDQGTSWRSLSFNDSSWKSGDGKFGYGVSGLNTVVSYGPNSKQKYVTTYFRKTISLSDSSNFISFSAGVLRDDGVVVYVNGVEVYRNNMPTGSVNYLTFGKDASDNGTVTQAFTINRSAFVNGNNIVAVEIHQKTVNNADLAFDMQLSGLKDETPPVVVSIQRQSPATQLTNASTLIFSTTFSKKVRGVDITDFTLTTVSGTASGVLANGGVAAVGTDSISYDVTVSSVQGDGTLRLDVNGSGTGITDTANNALSAGFTSGETYIIQQQVPDGPPVVTSINRQLPVNQNTDTTTVTFRVIFSKKVRGVDAADFITVATSGNVRGTLSKVALQAASTALTDAVKVGDADSTTYDVAVRALAGNGVLRLDVKGSNTGITDVSGNALSAGFTNGETYTINVASSQCFQSFMDLDPVTISSTTREIPQAKVWNYAGKWWAVAATSAGTKIFRLDNTSWTDVLTIATATNSRTDCRVVGNLVHLLLFRGASSTSYLVSLEFDVALNTYKRWTQRTSNVNIVFEAGSITATLDRDGTGRLWIASSSNGNTLLRWSDAPYSSWSAPITIASGGISEDICAITALPGKIGVFWSNQTAKRFGFKTHTDGADPTLWSADEVPASQSALNVGSGMADNYVNVLAASDGTLYCAVKTGYDKAGLPTMALLVRRPNNSWDNLYPVTSSKEGNRPIVILNEAAGKVKVIYSTHLDNFNGTRSGDVLYRESPTSNISFGPPVTLLNGLGVNNLEYTTCTHQTYNPAIVILTTNESVNPLLAYSVLATDEISPGNLARSATALPTEPQAVRWFAYPNPFVNNTLIDFSLPLSGRYSITLYDSQGRRIKELCQGWAAAGIRNYVPVNGSYLCSGLYLIKIQADSQIQTLKLLKK